MSDSSDRYLVPSVVAAVRILNALAEPQRASATQVELARALDLSKSTLHNLLATLEHLELVARDEGTRQYRLGPALVALGGAAQHEMDLLALASRRIVAFAAETGLSVAVARVSDGKRVEIVDRAYPSDSLFVGIALGGEFGCFDGAIGKCLLAAMEPTEAERLVRSTEIPARTPSTVTAADDLLSEVEAVRDNGWATAVQEFNDNNAVAAPVYGPNGDFELLLLALGFPGQLPEASIGEVGALLKRTADAVTIACGGSPKGSRRDGTTDNPMITTGPSPAEELTGT